MTTFKIIVCLLSIIELVYSEFSQIISELDHGKLDLGDNTDFQTFMKGASAVYPKSDLFSVSVNQESFIKRTLEKTIKQTYNQGLQMAQLVVCSAPFTHLVMNQDIIEDPSDLNGEAAEIVATIANRFRLRINNMSNRLWYFSEAEDLATIYQKFETCAMNSDWLDFRSTVLFLGDGTINNELDEEGKELEGYNHSYTTCYLTNGLQSLLNCPKFFPYLDPSDISAIISTLQRTGAIERYMSSLSQDSCKFQKMESFLLTSVSMMKVGDEILLSAGFKGHATTILIVKISDVTYDIYAFNTGAGLQHHDSLIRDSQRKYFAAKRYIGLTLFALHRKHFFRKYAEIKGIGHYGFHMPDENIPVDENTFYGNFLSCLDDFNVPYTIEDLNTVPLIPVQRSGSCSMRSLLAYVLWKVEKRGGSNIISSNKRFRILKLMLYDVVISKALMKSWKFNAYTLKRVLKFGIENFARSLLRFGKERKQGDPNLDIFNVGGLITSYETITAKRSPKEQGAIPSKAAIDFSKENSKFIGSEKSYWKDAYCENDFQLLHTLNSANLLDQTRLLGEILSGKWVNLDSVNSLAFVLTVIINKWPDPGSDLYTSIPEMEIDSVSEALYELAIKVNALASNINRIHWPTFSFYAKLFQIVTDLFAKIHPDIKRCKVLTMDISSYTMSYLMTDPQQVRTIKDLYNSGDVECFDNASNKVKEASPLEKFFTNRKISSQKEIISAFCNPMGFDLPKVAHYWRLMAKIVKYSEGMMDHILKFQHVPPKSPDQCVIEVINYKTSAKCNSDRILVGLSWREHRLEIETGYKNVWPHRSSTLSSQHTCPADVALMDHVLFGVNDYVGRYYRVLKESCSQMSWSSTVHLGLRAIATDPRADPQVISALTDLMEQKISESLGELKDECLSDISKLSQGVISNVKRISGFMIVLSYAYKLLGSRTVTMPAKRSRYYDFMVSSPMHPKLYSYMALGYILSIQKAEMTIDEARIVLVLNYKLNGLVHRFDSDVEKVHYRFQAQMVASAAVANLWTEKGSNFDDIISVLFKRRTVKEIAYPSVLLDDGIIVDLLSGKAFSDGLLISQSSFSEIEPLLNGCGLNGLESKSFSTISSSVTNLGPIFSCSLEVTEQLKYIDGMVYSLVQLQLLKQQDNIIIRETFVEPQSQAKIHSVSVKMDLSTYPIPYVGHLGMNYRVRIFNDNLMEIFCEREVIWVHNGVYSFPNYDLRDLKYSGPSIFDSLIPLSNKIICFEKNGQLYLLLKNYCDDKRRFIWIVTAPALHLRNNPELLVHLDQSLIKDHKYPNYLLLKECTSGNKKLLLPIEHYRANYGVQGEELVEKQTSSVSPNFKHLTNTSRYLKETFLVDIIDGSVSPKSRLAIILLAYHALVSRRYRASFNYVRRIHQMNPLTPEELKIIGWILFSNISNGDGSPESTAVRAYAVFKLIENQHLFTKGRGGGSRNYSKEENEEFQKKTSITGDEVTDWWVGYWVDVSRDHVIHLRASYSRIVSKIPLYLRFDAESPRPLITAFQQQSWIGGPLFGVTTNVIDTGSRVEASKEVCLPEISPSDIRDFLGARNSPPNKSLLENVSYLSPSGFTDKSVIWILNCIFNGDWTEEEKERFDLFLDSFEHTSAEQIARNLKKILNSTVRVKIAASLKKVCSDFGALGAVPCADAWETAVKKFGWTTQLNQIDLEIPSTNNSPSLKCETLPNALLSTPHLFENAAIDLNSIKFDLEEMISDHPDNLSDASERQILIDDYQAMLKRLSSRATSLKDAIMKNIFTLQSGSPAGSSVERGLLRLARGSFKISTNDLLYLYCHANVGKYIEIIPELRNQANLSRALQPIHNKLTEYVLTLTNINDLKRIISALDKYAEEPNLLKVEVIDRVRTTQTDQNAMLAYEYYINSRLTEQQVDDLVKMTALTEKETYPHKVLQRMMSAGKTFIYGTVLAFMKADRLNLSVLVVPRSLYASEVSSIISRTMSAFDVDGFSFNITRDDSDESIQALAWIDDALKAARQNGKYLILSPETLLTLHNKFIEATLQRNENVLLPLRSICSELRLYGAATFEEIDTAFNPNQELNFPLSDISLDFASADLRNERYMLCEVAMAFMTKEVQEKANILQNVVPSSDAIENACNLAADHLVTKWLNPGSFLLLSIEPMDIQELGGLGMAVLKKFFTEKDLDETTISNVCSSVTSETFRLLAICRLMFTDWMRVAWSGNIMEHYGLDDTHLFAVPYHGAGVPKEGSEFSFRWYTYSRTIRLYLITGFNSKVFRESLTYFKEMSLKSSLDSEIPNSSRPEVIFFNLFQKRILGLDFSDNSVVGELEEDFMEKSKTMSNEYLIYMFEFICDHIIPSVRYYDRQISSCAQDFTMMFNSIQGYSGTISSTIQLPRYFLQTKNIELDTDIIGKIRNKIVNDNDFTPILVDSSMSSTNIIRLMQKHIAVSQLKSQDPTIERPFNAIIDVGAFFKNHTNEKIAESLKENTDAVFFYSTAAKTRNQLVLLHGNHAPKVIESVSKASIEALNLDSKERVTFYDQSHCTGSDIFQDDVGYALVFIGAMTTGRDFYQAVMRMRKFLENQRIILAVPNEILNIIRQVTRSDQMNVKNILMFMEINERNKLRQGNSVALQQSVREICRNVIYEDYLLKNAYVSSEMLEFWMKGSESSLIDLIQPRVSIDYPKFLHKIYTRNFFALKSSGVNKLALLKVRGKLELLRYWAYLKHKSEFPEAETESYASDSDGTVETQADSNQNVNAAQENETTSECVATSAAFVIGHALTPVDFHLPTLPIVSHMPLDFFDVGKSDVQPVSVLVLKKRPFDFFENGKPEIQAGFMQVRKMMSDIFSNFAAFKQSLPIFYTDGLLMSTAFMGRHFGETRLYIQYLLLLRSKDDRKVIMIESLCIELVKAAIAAHNSLFGYEAILIDISGIILATTKPARDPTQFNDLAVEAIINDGNLELLSSETWLRHFKDWIRMDPITRSVFFKEIILSDKEKKNISSFPALSNLLSSADEYSSYLNSDEFFYLSFLNPKPRHLQAIQSKLDLLQASLTDTPDDFQSVEEITNIYVMARYSNIIGHEHLQKYVITAICGMIKTAYIYEIDYSNKDALYQFLGLVKKVVKFLNVRSLNKIIKAGSHVLRTLKDDTDDVTILNVAGILASSVRRLLELESQQKKAIDSEKPVVVYYETLFEFSQRRENLSSTLLSDASLDLSSSITPILSPLISNLPFSAQEELILSLQSEPASSNCPLYALFHKMVLNPETQAIKEKLYEFLAKEYFIYSTLHQSSGWSSSLIWDEFVVIAKELVTSLKWCKQEEFRTVAAKKMRSLSDLFLLATHLFHYDKEALHAELFPSVPLSSSESEALLEKYRQQLSSPIKD